MKEMVYIVPSGSCPKCGHKHFVIIEHQINEYLTNADGEIIDSLDIDYDAEGMCINCHSRYKMYPTREGFIPLTKLRAIMLDYTGHVIDSRSSETFIHDTLNPMEMNLNAR